MALGIGKIVDKAAKSTLRIGRQADLFHGTATRWADDLPRSIEHGGAAADQLFGPGLYMTQNPRISEDYLRKGLDWSSPTSASPTRYRLGWNTTPNLIDLEKPLSDDVIEAMRPILETVMHPGIVHSYKGSKASGKYVYRTFKDRVLSLTNYGDDVNKPLIDMANALRGKGYHGFTHEGGVVTGGASHRVEIAFAPERDIAVLEARRETFHLDEAIAEKQALVSRRPILEDPGAEARWQESVASTQAEIAQLRQNKNAIIAERVHSNIAKSSAARRGLKPRSASVSRLQQMKNASPNWR